MYVYIDIHVQSKWFAMARYDSIGFGQPERLDGSCGVHFKNGFGPERSERVAVQLPANMFADEQKHIQILGPTM